MSLCERGKRGKRGQVLNYQFLRAACGHGQTLTTHLPWSPLPCNRMGQRPPGYLSRRSGSADVVLGPGRCRKALPLALPRLLSGGQPLPSAISKIFRNRSARQRYFKTCPLLVTPTPHGCRLQRRKPCLRLPKIHLKFVRTAYATRTEQRGGKGKFLSPTPLAPATSGSCRVRVLRTARREYSPRRHAC